MDHPKRMRLNNIFIRVCDKFTRTEVNVICPVIKAENSVRVLYKLQKELFYNTLRTAKELNGFTLHQVHWKSPDDKMNESTLFLEYIVSQDRDPNDCRTLKKNLESGFAEVLKGRYTLIDKVDDMQETVPQPIISEVDFKLHKLKLFSTELNRISIIFPDLYALAEATEFVLDDLKECYTKFAVLSQNGKGKSFILNLLLLMTADSEEEYITNNRDMQLPEGFPDHVQWENVIQTSNLPDVVKDFIQDNKVKYFFEGRRDKLPVCYPLTCHKDTKESVTSFSDFDKYFSERHMLDLEPYLLSQKGAERTFETTTKCIIQLRYGSCYQMKVEYYEAEELQQQLYELFITDTDDSNVKEDVKEQAERCLKARYKELIGHEFSQEESVKHYEDIQLCEEVLEFAGKTELYIGRGENSTYDRLALQEVLKALTTVQEEDRAEDTKRKIAAVKEILVYVPSKILHGNKELLEMPGTDDSDPIAMFSISNALSEADAVIFVSEYGFTICEKEVKDMLSDSGFLQKFDEDPTRNKLMLIAYPEKNFKWQFSPKGKNKIETVETEARKKKEKELKEIAKLLKRKSIDHEKSIFSTYLLPVLHSSILSQKEPQPEHEIIAKHSNYLKHTGIMEFFYQLDEYVLSKQKTIFDLANKPVEHFLGIMDREMTTDTAREILKNVASKEFDKQLKEQNRKFEETLNKVKGKLLANVDKMVENMMKDYIPKAKQQWDTNKDKVTSIAAYNPNFIGKNPKFKVRLFHIIFEGFEEKKIKLFEHIIQEITKVFDNYKTYITNFYTANLKAFLNPLGITVSQDFVKNAIIDKLNTAYQRYKGNITRPFSEKTLGKLMEESQRASLKYVILEKNYRKTSLEEAKISTETDIEECIMKVKDIFMIKLNDLHNYRFKSVYTLLCAPNGGSKIWKELELELKRTARDRNEEHLDQVIKSMKTLMEASFNGSEKQDIQEM